MAQKLSKERAEEIRGYLAQANSKAMQYWTYDDENAAIGQLLAELDRTRPAWVPLAAGQHMSGRWYHVAGRTQATHSPVWMGRGKFDDTWGLWIDANTLQPFAKGIELTHYLQELTPTEIIGQPEVG